MGETLYMDKDDARALLTSTQQLRTHWSGVITTHLTVALTMNAALWTYFLNGYFESPDIASGPYLLVVSGLSSILFGLWRLNARHIDHQIASLYPDLLLYEGKLAAPSTRSTSGYLSTALPRLRSILQCDQFSLENKVELISDLVRGKKIGQRGHRILDFFALAILVVITIPSVARVVSSIRRCSWDLWFLWLIANGLGFLFLLLALTRYQKNPNDHDVEELITRFKKSSP